MLASTSSPGPWATRTPLGRGLAWWSLPGGPGWRRACEWLKASFLYLQGYLKECNTLPPDYISTLSFFFPVFPAYDAAVAMSCLEFFLEWRCLPEFKFWRPVIILGLWDG